jgi:hypothetical protein
LKNRKTEGDQVAEASTAMKLWLRRTLVQFHAEQQSAKTAKLFFFASLAFLRETK